MNPRNATVADYMTRAVQTVGVDMLLPAAAAILAQSRYASVPVVDDTGAIIGVLSRTDVVRLAHASGPTADHALALPAVPVGKVMTQGPLLASPTTALGEAAKSMVELGVHRLFVVSHGVLCGVISTLDVTRGLADSRLATRLRPYVTRLIKTLPAEATVAEAVATLDAAQVSALIILDEAWPVGTFGQVDALGAGEVRANAAVADVMERAIICMPPDTKLWHAASQVVAMDVRRIIVCEKGDAIGVTSTLDLARAFADHYAAMT